MSYAEAPLYVRTYDLTRELLHRTARFPRSYRASLGARLQQASLSLTEAIMVALLHPRERERALADADRALLGVRLALRLAGDLGVVDEPHAGRLGQDVAAIGRMLGGWRRDPKLETAPSAR
ncbi:MAG: four helix bundle protein [Deltaproteobacteria bacterium]